MFYRSFVMLILLSAGLAVSAVEDVKPRGSAWLDEEGQYAGSARDPKNTLCELKNKHIRVVQNIYPHYNAMGSLEISDADGSLLFRVPIAMGGHASVPGDFGHYGTLGHASGRRPTADSIHANGGVFYRDWSDQEWRVWTRQEERSISTRDPVRGLELFPWGMPDFQSNEFKRRFRWMYRAPGTDFLFQMETGQPHLDLWLVPRIKGKDPVKLSWRSGRHPTVVVASGDEKRRLLATEDAETEFSLGAERFVTVYLLSEGAERVPFFSLCPTGEWEDSTLTVGPSRDKTKYGRYTVSLRQGANARQRLYVRFGHRPAGKVKNGLTVRPFDRPVGHVLKLTPETGRRVYVRGEKVPVTLDANLPDADPTPALNFRLETSAGETVVGRKINVEKGGGQLSVPTTHLPTGNHTLWAEGRIGDEAVRCRFDFYVSPGYQKTRFVRHMYGMGCSPSFLPWLEAHGFNAVYRNAHRRNFQQVLDLAPKYGVKVIASLQHSLSYGKATDCNNNPEAFGKNVEHFAEFMGQYGDYPGLGYVASRSEVGDSYCGCEFCVERLKEETDLEEWRELSERKNYEPGIVDDDNPYLRFVRWWKTRGGIATLHGGLDRTVEKANPEIRTLHDEGFVSIGHNWAGYVNGMYDPLDTMLKWTYVNPLSQVPFWTKVLMGAADPGQTVLPNTQLLWKPGMATDTGHAVTPELAREATWLTAMWGPASMSHWASFLVRPEGERRYTPPDKGDFKGLVYQPETGKELARLWAGPLGRLAPALARLQVANAPVAMLYSYTDEAFTVWGHQGHLHRRFRDLVRAHIPVDIVFEEDIGNGVLSNYEVLIISGVRYMRRSFHERMERYCEDEGTLILDAETQLDLPGERVKVGDVAGVRAAVDGGLDEPLYADCDSPDVYLNTLKAGPVRYVFAVNDRRKFGPGAGEK